MSNETLARTFLQAWAADGEPILDDLADPDIVVSYTHFPDPLRGRHAFRQALRKTHDYFPDLAIEAEEVITCADEAVVRWIYRATHRRGEMFGVQARGARVEVRGISIYHIEGGRVRKESGVVDNLGLMAQLQGATG